MARKVGFHKGALGSPFQLEYEGDEGIDMGPGGEPSERGPRIGSGVLGRRVEMEVARDAGRGRGRRGRRGGMGDVEE